MKASAVIQSAVVPVEKNAEEEKASPSKTTEVTKKKDEAIDQARLNAAMSVFQELSSPRSSEEKLV